MQQQLVSISIQAPADRVWSVMSDVVRWREWTASVTSIERLDDGPLQVGSRARVRQPKLATLVYTVTRLDPGRSFAWRAESTGLTIVGDHRIEPGPGDAVTVTLSIYQSGVLAPLVARLAAGLTRRYMTMEAEGLKRRSESSCLAPAA